MKGVLDEAPLLALKKKLEAGPALLCSIVSPQQSYSSSTSVLMTQVSGVSLGGAFVPRMVSATFDDKRCYERLCLSLDKQMLRFPFQVVAISSPKKRQHSCIRRYGHSLLHPTSHSDAFHVGRAPSCDSPHNALLPSHSPSSIPPHGPPTTKSD